MARNSEIRYINYLVEGNAARVLEPTPKKRKAELPKAPKRKRANVIHIDIMAVTGIVLSVVMATVLLVGFVRLQEIDRQAVAMESYVLSLQNQNAELRYEYQNSFDLESVRTVAESMGYVSIDSIAREELKLPVVQETVKVPFWQKMIDYIRELFV